MEFNALIPELTVSDVQRSVRFYCDRLGFRIGYERPEDGFVFLQREECQIMIEEDRGYWQVAELHAPYGRGINLQCAVSAVAPILASLGDYPLFRDVEEVWYAASTAQHGVREFLVQDPDGYLLRFSESLGSRPL